MKENESSKKNESFESYSSKVAVYVDACIREYLKRNRYEETLKSFDLEHPRDENAISSREVLARGMGIENIVVANRSKESPFRSFLEMIVDHFIEKKGGQLPVTSSVQDEQVSERRSKERKSDGEKGGENSKAEISSSIVAADHMTRPALGHDNQSSSPNGQRERPDPFSVKHPLEDLRETSLTGSRNSPSISSSSSSGLSSLRALPPLSTAKSSQLSSLSSIPPLGKKLPVSSTSTFSSPSFSLPEFEDDDNQEASIPSIEKTDPPLQSKFASISNPDSAIATPTRSHRAGKEFHVRFVSPTKEYSYEKKNIFIRKINNEKIIRYPGQISGNAMLMEDIVDSKVYVVDHTGQITIDRCQNSTIFVAACSSSIFARNCDNCIFIACCHQWRTRDLVNCEGYLWCQTNPTVELTTNFLFSPLEAHFPRARELFDKAKLDRDAPQEFRVHDFNDGETLDQYPDPHWKLLKENIPLWIIDLEIEGDLESFGVPEHPIRVDDIPINGYQDESTVLNGALTGASSMNSISHRIEHSSQAAIEEEESDDDPEIEEFSASSSRKKQSGVSLQRPDSAGPRRSTPADGSATKTVGWQSDRDSRKSTFISEDESETINNNDEFIEEVIDEEISGSPVSMTANSNSSLSAIVQSKLVAGVADSYMDRIDSNLAEQTRFLLLGSLDRLFPSAWIFHGFPFSDTPGLEWGLVQLEGGPCGVLACVQAYICKYLLFEDRDAPKGIQNINASVQRDALVYSLTTILWRIAEKSRRGAVLVSPLSGRTRNDISIDRMRCLCVHSEEEVKKFFSTFYEAYQEPAGLGLLAFTVSCILTRGPELLDSDMDEQVEDSLIVRWGYASQEVINLLLTGIGSSNTCDGDKNLGEDLILRGVRERSEIGFLTSYEVFGHTTVEQNFKNPIYPIWIICSESHYTVAFLHNHLDTSKPPVSIELYWYDQLAKMDEVSHLTLAYDAEFVPPDPDEDGTILEQILWLKWPRYQIDWNGGEIYR